MAHLLDDCDLVKLLCRWWSLHCSSLHGEYQQRRRPCCRLRLRCSFLLVLRNRGVVCVFEETCSPQQEILSV